MGKKFSNILTEKWRGIVQEKKKGENRLLYLVEFNEKQKIFLEDMEVVRIQIFSKSYCVFNIVSGEESYILEADSRKKLVSRKGELPFLESQLALILGWLMELNEQTN